MESLSRFHNCHQTLYLSLSHRRPSFPEPISSLFLKIPSSSSVRSASSSPSPSSSWPEPKLAPSQTLMSLFRITFPTMASTATAALLFTLMRFDPKTLVVPASTLEPSGESSGMTIRYFDLKVKMKVVDYVIEVKPDDQAWHLLKFQIRSYSQELDSARYGFQEILAKDLLCHKAYSCNIRGCLEMANELKDVSTDIEVAMENCTYNDIKYYLRDFKDLVARVKDSKGQVFGALAYFQELEQEEDNES
ncbi:uncharacterized protein LOC122287324 [Carya illinoinensis]|uniref:Uncharacterized protein n=1 Tax=Carya illinoinensis TaxID=32201 RepID=A0A8T1RSJ6_CARIL|nr:uncharacterized protein LOC122287324 [Carya illinoinensis]KAG6669718.1 hypothetical protein CIPAW_01G263400 [Carya illinoinensis]KAG6734266.1 hypothetical protein I3842_01G265200 [Carya illinoinensis]